MNFNLLSRPATLAAAAVVALTASVSVQAAGIPSSRGVGVNLNGFDYFSPDVATIDQFKRAGGWFTQCSYPRDAGCKNFTPGQSGWDTLEQSKMDVDENGYPKSLPAAGDTNVKYRTVAALMFQDDARVHAAGKYIVLYDGEGTIEYSMAGSKVAAESKAGRDVVQVTNSGSEGMLLTIKATTPGNHIRNVRVLPPGGVCSGDKNEFALDSAACTAKGLGTLISFENLDGRMWHPNYVKDLKGFRSLRFLDWNRTNTSQLANWEDRPRWNDAMWTGPAGVPVNAMVSLANEVGADPWINLPTHATDDYALKFARQLKQILAPKLNLIVEYSNEPWNYGFSQSLWMRDQAAATWPEEIKKGVSVYDLQPNWYGMRSAQLCKIIKTEFGADANRVKCVFNGQASNSWVSKLQMDCTYAQAKIGGQACYKVMDGMAIAPYFGGYIGDKAARGVVQSWYGDSDGGLTKLFMEITGEDANGNKLTQGLLYGVDKEAGKFGALEQSRGWMVSNKTEASNRGMPLMAYEGGQHLIMYPGDTDQKYLNLITNANRDPRMGKAYTRTLNDWQAAGGQTYTLFNHVYKPSKYGMWGLKETQLQTNSPKWQAVLPYRDTKPCWWNGCER